jgi:uncharacterized protein (TIGR04222 family)
MRFLEDQMGNVLDLRGPEFLQFFAWLTGGGFAVGLFVRWFYRFPGGDPPRPVSLDLDHLAVLAGTSRRRVDAALAGMVYAGWLEVDIGTRRLRKIVEPLNGQADAVERSIFNLCSESGTRLSDLRQAGVAAAAPIEQKLRSLELVTAPGPRRLAIALPLGVMAFILMVGVCKIVVGISRNRPVGFLVIFCLFDLLLAAAIFGRVPWRTRRGSVVLGDVLSNELALRTSVKAGGSHLQRTDIVRAFALFGPSVLPGDYQMKRFAMLLQPVQSTSSGGHGGCGSGGGCGGGGGGGGGGGCGGCGGGGH